MIEVVVALLEELPVVDGGLRVQEVEDVVVLWQRLNGLVGQEGVCLQTLPEMSKTPRRAGVVENVRILR